MPENQVWIHTQIAANLGVADGQKIVLENHDGAKSLPIAVRATEAVRSDCAYMVHGFGTQARGLRKAYRKRASDTQLITRVAVDPIMGATGMRVNFVRVLSATGEEG